MGRPLYSSTLLARRAPAVPEHQPIPIPPQSPQASVPVVEKWTRWNAFDPDSDEFFEAEDAVYEAFLTEEEVNQRERGTSQNTAPPDSRAPAQRMAEAMGFVAVNDAIQGDIEYYFMGTPPPETARRAEDRDENAATVGGSGPLVPHINVSSPRDENTVRSPSPDPLNIISGVTHLSESPRPMAPDLPTSPVPDTPARVSGVFDIPPSAPRAAQLPSSPSTSRTLDIYGSPWVRNRSPGSGPRYHIAPVPAPLTS